jgi:acyl phosphate:glycerol-3-phosphate acyltransferase
VITPSLALALVAAYLVGAVPVGLLVARMAGGGDIRRRGSGNIGSTNVLRTLGLAAGIATLAGDVLKGWLAVSAARALAPDDPWAPAAGAVAAVAGNCWPVFLRFRGGKGVATGLGTFLALAPWALVPAVVAFAVVVAATRFVSLASLCGALSLPIGSGLLGYGRAVTVAAAAVFAIVLLRHRANVQRLTRGTESRLGQRAAGA